MLSQIYALVALLLPIAIQAQDYEYLEAVIKRAQVNLASYESGNNIRKPVFKSDGVALDLGKLNNETAQHLPDNLKIAIAGCYEKLNTTNGKYEEVLSMMMQHPMLETKGQTSVKQETRSMSKTTKMGELDYWFWQLINDPEFLAETHLCADSPPNMAKATKVMYKCTMDDCSPKDYIIKLSVLQYPQNENGIFVLYHVTLTSWFDCSGKQGGITGKYQKSKFGPRNSVINLVTPDTRKKILGIFKETFDKIEPKKETTPCKPPITSSASSLGSSGYYSTLLMSTVVALLTTATLMKKIGGDDDDDVGE